MKLPRRGGIQKEVICLLLINRSASDVFQV